MNEKKLTAKVEESFAGWGEWEERDWFANFKSRIGVGPAMPTTIKMKIGP